MRTISLIIVAALTFAPAAHAEGAFDWLGGVTAKSGVEAPADSAKLVTLEPKESEMYPKVSADGRYLLVNTRSGKKAWISRRATENGDPINVVSEDDRSMDSIQWQGSEKVRLLSERAMGLGLWERNADGTGVFRRTHELTGVVTQPVSLPDGAIIAVSMVHVGKAKTKLARIQDEFDNWEPKGLETHIVRIDADGSEKILSKGINPAVSPDGQWVVFSMAIGRSWHLFMARPDGADLTQLTDERSVDVQPTWSADGKWIVFTSNRAQVDVRKQAQNNWDIWAIDRNGGNLTRLTEDEARDGAPSVAPNGKVYFHSDRNISKALQKDRQATSRSGSFHIWSVELPKD